MSTRYAADYISYKANEVAGELARETDNYAPEYSTIYSHTLINVIEAACSKNHVSNDECYDIRLEIYSHKYGRWETVASYDLNGRELA